MLLLPGRFFFFFSYSELVAEEETKVTIVSVSNEPIH